MCGTFGLEVSGVAQEVAEELGVVSSRRNYCS